MTTAIARPLTDEQTRLINEIWDHAERLYKGFGPESLKELVTCGEETLDEFHLRQVALELKEKYRKSKVKTKPCACDDGETPEEVEVT